MKHMLVVLTLTFASALFVFGCGGGEQATPKGGVSATATKAPAGNADSAATPKPGATVQPTADSKAKAGGDWSDMPSYPGATQMSQVAFQIPGAATPGDYKNAEWRYFETKDDVGKVTSFFKAEMLKNGWKEQGWMTVAAGMAWGMYDKDGEEQAAYILVTRDESANKTMIGLWRASGKQ